MSRISPDDLPQPIYPGGRAPAALPQPSQAAVSAPLPAAPSPTAPARRHRPGRSPVPKAAIWAGLAAIAAVAVVVAVVVLTRGKPSTGPVPGGGTQSSADTSSAVNELVSGVQLTNAEYSCLFNDLDARPDLVAAIRAGSYDTAAAAEVIAGCVSTETVADLLDVAFQSAGVDAVTASCIRTELAAMSESSLADTVQALLDGSSDALAQVLATEAASCFPAG